MSSEVKRLKVLSKQLELTVADTMTPSPLTTHVLNTAVGQPAAGLPIELYRIDSGGAEQLMKSGNAKHWFHFSCTNSDGRLPDLLTQQQFIAGTYKLRFDTGTYFQQNNTESFYPYAEVVFIIRDPTQHYHVPLLLNPFGYTTYRGS